MMLSAIIHDEERDDIHNSNHRVLFPLQFLDEVIDPLEMADNKEGEGGPFLGPKTLRYTMARGK